MTATTSGTRMTKADAWRIEKAAAGEARSIRRLLSESDLPTQGLDETQLWCAKDGTGRVVGVAGLETWGGQGLLRSVAVDATTRGRGLGTTLVRRILDEAKMEGLEEVYLLTETAPAFFAKLGFRPLARGRVRGSVLGSAEFREVCPDTAPMILTLGKHGSAYQKRHGR